MGHVIIVARWGIVNRSVGRSTVVQAQVGLPQYCKQLLQHPGCRGQLQMPQPRKIQIFRHHRPRKTERGNGKRAIAISQVFGVEGGIVHWFLACK